MTAEEYINAYRTSGLDGNVGFLMPDGKLSIELADGEVFTAPNDETEDSFLDRIKRSVKAGRNLFTEEWKEFIPESDMIY